MHYVIESVAALAILLQAWRLSAQSACIAGLKQQIKDLTDLRAAKDSRGRVLIRKRGSGKFALAPADDSRAPPMSEFTLKQFIAQGLIRKRAP